MRQIIFDTETTGFYERKGDRIVEIGCVELVNRRPTGNTFHHYLNPDRESDPKALEKHGLTSAFLEDKPRFENIANAFLDFVRGAELIAHNASFDVRFIDMELERCGETYGSLADHVTGVVDTLAMARKEYPGAPATLDALCKRFDIDLTGRNFHGALLDSRLLADVYLAMTAKQGALGFGEEDVAEQTGAHVHQAAGIAPFDIRVIRASEDELARHEKRLAAIIKAAGKCLWQDGGAV